MRAMRSAIRKEKGLKLMAGINSLGTGSQSELEMEQLVHNMFFLWEQGLHGSTRILVSYLLVVQPSYSYTLLSA